MPAFMKRIILLLVTITLASFFYENSYLYKATASRGEIKDMFRQARATMMLIEYPLSGNKSSSIQVAVLIHDIFIRKYRVGDSVPVVYCNDCIPEAKIDRISYLYSMTLMILILDFLVLISAVIGLKFRKKE